MNIQIRRWRCVGFSLSILACSIGSAQATPYLVVDVASGNIIMQQESTQRWFPDSLTKLVTLYAALTAVRQGRISLDTPIVYSNRAARMPPSKMGFKPGTEVTLDNALKMLMVKSANDIAITVAEGVGGSVEGFADQMNAVAARLGMHDSHFVNPNGLHDDNHYSSARDMAIVGRALYQDFPDHADLYGIGALRLGSQIIPTHNGLMGRYPGADGMKTGFTCPAGFNVVASATRGGRHLIAVVLGYPSAKSRTLKTASLLDAGFAMPPSGGPLAALATAPGGPPNMRPQVCGAHRQEVAEDDFAVPVAAANTSAHGDGDTAAAFFSTQGMAAPASGVAAIQSQMGERPYFEPIPVYIGRAPGWTGNAVGSPEALAFAARPKTAGADTETSTPAPRGHGRKRPGKTGVQQAKPAAAVAAAAKPATKPVVKPVAKTAAKPEQKASDKAGGKPAARTAPHKPAAKPANQD